MVSPLRLLCVLLGFAFAAPLAAQEFTGGPLPPRALARLGSPRFACDSVVRAAAFSRDGKLLAVGTQGYGLIEPTGEPPEPGDGPVQFRTVYRLTAKGRDAAEHGEYQVPDPPSKGAAPKEPVQKKKKKKS